MILFKLCRTTHKWIGILLSLLLLNIAVTGMLLLLKKEYDWIQPPTKTGAEGVLSSFKSTEEILQAVLSQGHEDFQSLALEIFKCLLSCIEKVS